MHKLLLFDIDGTLLRCGPQVRPLFLDALEAVFGVCDSLEGFDFSGRTDPSIVLELARSTGRAEEEILRLLPEVQRRYLANLDAGLERRRMKLLPGVAQLLEGLVQRQDVLVGLLTGNWQQGAMIKLSRFDLNGYFRFGAFGDDAIERRELVPVALQRASDLRGDAFSPQDVLIIGDTLRDVDCAQASGIPCLAVATGFTKAEHLEAAGADWVFNDLEEAAREMDIFFPRP
jgi:phosphoglycolate phosphatase-like HAD superfamily hydrolase